jgi:hypothetical protein
MVRLLELGRKADGNTSGEYTARAIEAFEPHVIWQGEFLKIRAVAYRNVRSRMADQAMEDLIEFTSHESAIANVSAMARAIRSAEGTAKIEADPAAAFAARP